MEDKKKPKTISRAIEPANVPTAEELQKQLLELQRQEIETVTKAIESIEEENKVGIGVQLDIRKLTDVIAYMITNNKQTISLKFEVWKT